MASRKGHHPGYGPTHPRREHDLATTVNTNKLYPAQRTNAPAQPVVQQPPPDDSALVSAIAAILVAKITMKVMKFRLLALLEPYGITADAVLPVLGLTLDTLKAFGPKNELRIAKTAAEHVGVDPLGRASAANIYYASAYLLHGSYRVQKSINAGKPVREAINIESSYYRAHRKASDDRTRAINRVKLAADMHGNLLGWYLNPLLNNEYECIVANGNNFEADKGTVIGYPGTVHANCGCTAGPPHPEGQMVNDLLGNVVRWGTVKKLRKLRSANASNKGKGSGRVG